MTTIEKRTEEEINNLKRDWKDDPCWDLEDTEGFEAHIDELKAFRLQCEADWRAKIEARNAREEAQLRKEFDQLGQDTLFQLFKKYRVIQSHIQKLEDRVFKLENPND
ncbi:hypothetical protein OCF84_21700 (plasmid) [Shewanella xiamenensis]|uniref:Uncharacterized protein n=1 Tax=Shewanella xiamenensis TaxID=332186 RepID=A0ABT6UDF7_9GAMM|nr:hypothetical protein [Shewanella xiamenensis]MDI5832506.1 hypothetical protein [Shewanella xiamenensis]WHF57875.1 hypothetical protein OCF84_21700 [Shewanella xiamenensis]